MEETDPRQAVVLCDSFETRFGPLSLDTPKALFPVGQEPLIHRVLQFLDTAGVKRVILLCTAGSSDEAIRQVADRFSTNNRSMKVECVAVGTCLSLGDALRDLDSRKLITRHDFLLIRGDVIGSLNLPCLLAAHKENFKRDKGALMTMVMVPCSYEAASRHENIHDDVFVTDRKTGKLLHRQNLTGSPKLEFSAAFDDVDVRNNLQESGVYICGPGVPPAFSDNFDFQNMDDFVKGILNSEEILGNSLYLYVAANEDEFVCKLDSVSSWNKGFEDLCNRRAISRAFGDHVDFWNVYRSPSSKVDASAVLVKNVHLSSGSIVRAKAHLDGCFIGPNVVLSEGSRITSSQVWANARIGPGVVIQDSIVGENAIIDEGIVCESCIIGPGVVLRKKSTQGEPLRFVGLRLTSVVPEDATSDDESEAGSCIEHYSALNELSTDSRAYRFRDDRETENDVAFRRKERKAALTRVTSWLAESEDEDGEGSESDDGDETGSDFDDQLADRDEENGLRQFEREVADSLVRGIDESLPVDNLVLEINSSKHAYNIGFGDVVRITTREVLRRMNPDVNKEAVKRVMGRLWGVIANYVKKSGAHVLECMKGVEEYAAETIQFRGEPMLLVLNFLYSKDVLSESGILKWNKASDSATGADIRAKVKRFIDWLETAESESEEESEEEDSD